MWISSVIYHFIKYRSIFSYLIMNYIILYLEFIEGYKTFLNRFPPFKLHNLAQLHRFTINCSEIIHKKKQHPKMLFYLFFTKFAKTI